MTAKKTKKRAKKVTPAQRTILSRLARGERLHWMSGLDAYAFWSAGLHRVRYASLGPLIAARLVEFTGDRHKMITLTPEGAAIASP